MSGIRVEGNTSGNVAEVDANNNLKVVPPTDIAQAGYDVMIVENDPGAFTGAALRRRPFITEGFRLEVARDTPIFDYDFNATAQDTGAWKCAFTTMTMTAGRRLRAAQRQQRRHGGARAARCRRGATSTCSPTRASTSSSWEVQRSRRLANQIVEFGLFLPTTTAVPADGVYFRYTSAGLIGVRQLQRRRDHDGGPLGADGTGHVHLRLPDPHRHAAGRVLARTTCSRAPSRRQRATRQPYMTSALPVSMQFRNSGTVSASAMQWKYRLRPRRSEVSRLFDALPAPAGRAGP